MSDKQIAALNQASKIKQQEALQKTEKAINYLIVSKQKITLRAVAKQAGVSPSFIYKHPQIVTRIKTLKEDQKSPLNVNSYLPEVSRDRLKKLTAENTRLIAEIEQLKAYIETINDRKNSSLKLQIENSKLQLENQQLKQELEFVRTNLQEVRNFILDRGYDNQSELEIETRKRVMRKVTSDSSKEI